MIENDIRSAMVKSPATYKTLKRLMLSSYQVMIYKWVAEQGAVTANMATEKYGGVESYGGVTLKAIWDKGYLRRTRIKGIPGVAYEYTAIKFGDDDDQLPTQKITSNSA